MKILKVSCKTLYNWFNFWKLEGIVELYNKKEEVLSQGLMISKNS